MRTTLTKGSDHGAHPLLEITGMAAAAALPVAAIARWWAAIRQYQRDRLTRQILEGLDDRTLRDIGIDRSEIASIVLTRAAGRRWPYYDMH